MSNGRKDYGAPAALKGDDIDTVIELLSEGNNQTEVANLLEVSPTVISNLIGGRGAYANLRGTEKHNALLASLKRRKEDRMETTEANALTAKNGKFFKDKEKVAARVIELLLEKKSEEDIAIELDISMATVSRIRRAQGAYIYLVKDPKWKELEKVLGPVKRIVKKYKKKDEFKIKKTDTPEEAITKIGHKYDLDVHKVLELMQEGKTQVAIAKEIGSNQNRVSRAYIAWKALKIDGYEEIIKTIRRAVAENRGKRKGDRRVQERREDTTVVDEPETQPTTEEFTITEHPMTVQPALQGNDALVDSVDMAVWIQRKHKVHYLKWVIKGDLSVRYHLTYDDRPELENVYILKHHGHSKYSVVDEKFAKTLINDATITAAYSEIMGCKDNNSSYIKYIKEHNATQWIRRNEASNSEINAAEMTEKFWDHHKDGGFVRKFGSWKYHVKVSTEEGTVEDPKFELHITKEEGEPEVYVDDYQTILQLVREKANTKHSEIYMPRKKMLYARA